MSSISLREHIYAHPNHHSDDISAYEKYAKEEGWDLDTLYDTQSGSERATAFLKNFQYTEGITTITCDTLGEEKITVQHLLDFLQQLVYRDPDAAKIPISNCLEGCWDMVTKVVVDEKMESVIFYA